MNRAERKGLVFLLLAGYVGGAIVAAATLRPSAGPLRAVLFPGVAYLASLGALARFAEIAAVGPAAMNAVYAVAGYVLWWVGGYLLGVRVVGSPRGELRAMALAFPGVAGAGTGGVLLVGGVAGAAGLLTVPLSRLAALALAIVGVVLWFPSLAWLSRVRSRNFGWGARPLVNVDRSLEVGAYVLLSTGLALLAVAVAIDVGPQFLSLSVLGVLVVAITVVVPTGGATGSGSGF